MDFLIAFLGSGLFVVVGILVSMVPWGVAYVCGVPFDTSKFVVTRALGGFTGTALLLWAQFAARPQRPRAEAYETTFVCVLWWAILAGLVFLLAR